MCRWILVAFGVAMASPLNAIAGTITVTTDVQSFTKGVPFQVVSQVLGREVADIDLPQIDGATIEKRPSYSGTEVRFENGVLTSTKSLGYLVTPQRVGEIIIPPFKAEIDGELVTSQEFRVTVLDSPKTNDSTARSVSGDQILFTQIKTNKLEAYQGEAIILTMEVWIAEGGSVRYEPTGFPELTGFYALPRDPTEGKVQDRFETRDGKRYKVVPFVQILFPASSGELRIGPWTWSCSVAYRGFARNRDVKTDPFTIKVKPLPPPPEDFSGSVGKYQITAALSTNNTDVGVPLTMTVNISGNGNPDAIGAPRLPTIDGLYIDEPRRIQHPTQTGPTGEDFIYKLTPQRGGEIVVPVIGYVYFDPEQGTYQTAKTSPMILHVRAAKKEDQVVVGAGGAVSTPDTLGSDIMDLDTSARSLSRQGDLSIPTALGYGTPVLAYAALALYIRRQRRFASDRAFARKFAALKHAAERLDQARHSKQAADALYQAVTRYVADQFNLSQTGMTSAEARLFFDAHKIPSEIADAFHKILKACERARYAAAELSTDEVEAMIQGAQTGMQRLDEFLKREHAA